LPVIVIGGSNKSVGKTSLICGIVAAFPELRWTAVKITSHHYGQIEPVWEEHAVKGRQGGEASDTSRFLGAGAHKSFLVTASERVLPWREMEAALGGSRHVIFESNRIAKELRADLRLAVVSGTEMGFKLSFFPFLNEADAVIAHPGADVMLPRNRREIPVFRLSSPSEISQELTEWLRVKLGVEESRSSHWPDG